MKRKFIILAAAALILAETSCRTTIVAGKPKQARVHVKHVRKHPKTVIIVK